MNNKYSVATTEKEARQQILNIMENYSKNMDEMLEFLKFQSRFYQYSARNTMLIYMQNMGAMLCQSFKAWGKEQVDGKPVKILKGQHGMKILVPTTVTIVTLPDGTTKGLFYCTAEEKEKVKSGELESKKRTKFKIGTTFDIAQTDYPADKYPERLNRGRVSADHAKCFTALKTYSENTMNIPFFIGDAEEEINGAGLFGFCRCDLNGKREIHLARKYFTELIVRSQRHGRKSKQTCSESFSTFTLVCRLRTPERIICRITLRNLRRKLRRELRVKKWKK